MSGTYSEAELQHLEEIGAKRTTVALTDICQLHLSDYGGGR
ncbi:hypothetical protein [Halolamina sp.]